MRSTLNALFAIIVVSGSIVYSTDVQFGIKAGLNLGTMYGDDIDYHFGGMDKTIKPGFITGLNLRIQPSALFYISPEILFSMKGVAGESDFLGIQSKKRISTSYLELPVNFAFIIPAGTTVIPAVYAGPVIGITLASKTTVETAGNIIDRDNKEFVNEGEFSFDFGGGCEIKMENGCLLFDVRYTVGLTPLYDESVYRGDVRNGTLSFMAGWGFEPFKK